MYLAAFVTLHPDKSCDVIQGTAVMNENVFRLLKTNESFGIDTAFGPEAGNIKSVDALADKGLSQFASLIIKAHIVKRKPFDISHIHAI